MKKLLIVLLAIIICSYNYTHASMEPLIEGVIKRGVLRVGFAPFLPWIIQNKDGEYVGFDIDIAKRLAQDLGVTLQLVPTRWTEIIPSLLANKFDIIISGATITLERNLQVNFSNPYHQTDIEILANAKKVKGMKFPQDFNKPEVIVAIRNGSTVIIPAKQLLPNASFRLFDDEVASIKDVESGHSHILLASAPLPTFQAINSNGNLIRLDTLPITHQSVGFAIKKGDPDSLNVLNNWIKFIENEGWLSERKNYWFNSLKWKNEVI